MPLIELQPLIKHSEYGDVFQHVLEEILPPLNMKNGPWLAGGAVRRVLEGQEEYTGSDFDVWFANEDQTGEFFKQIEKHNGTCIVTSNNATTYKVPLGQKNVIIQLIQREYFNSPKEVIQAFDFIMSQCLTDGYTVLLGEDTAEDISNRELNVNCYSIQSPVSTIRRIAKFMSMGYKIQNDQIASLLRLVVNNPESIDIISPSEDMHEQQQEIQA